MSPPTMPQAAHSNAHAMSRADDEPVQETQPASSQPMDPQRPHDEVSSSTTVGLRGGDLCPGRFCFCVPCPIPQGRGPELGHLWSWEIKTKTLSKLHRAAVMLSWSRSSSGHDSAAAKTPHGDKAVTVGSGGSTSEPVDRVSMSLTPEELLRQNLVLTANYSRLQEQWSETEPFVAFIVDGDAYTFTPDLIGLGAKAAGREAARTMEAAVRKSLSEKGLGSDYPLSVRIYGNFSGRIAHCYGNRKANFLAKFISSFNAHTGFEMVDAGDVAQATDQKVSEALAFYGKHPRCKHIYFAACHDRDYFGEVAFYMQEKGRVILLGCSGVPLGKGFEQWKEGMEFFDDVFRFWDLAKQKSLRGHQLSMAGIPSVSEEADAAGRNAGRDDGKAGMADDSDEGRDSERLVDADVATPVVEQAHRERNELFSAQLDKIGSDGERERLEDWKCRDTVDRDTLGYRRRVYRRLREQTSEIILSLDSDGADKDLLEKALATSKRLWERVQHFDRRLGTGRPREKRLEGGGPDPLLDGKKRPDERRLDEARLGPSQQQQQQQQQQQPPPTTTLPPRPSAKQQAAAAAWAWRPRARSTPPYGLGRGAAPASLVTAGREGEALMTGMHRLAGLIAGRRGRL
ncbi:hypothetical protein P8C59_003793 [Phyllachora maydis]|uniref:DUF7923 domain-containing protein n=1 Tax=Phyllachora maydis TaxID=1825666 RepID=A0AAD9I248_9PEZI|nr:hypothetical protein P8C59_003793 [Phyllachora maydis]